MKKIFSPLILTLFVTLSPSADAQYTLSVCHSNTAGIVTALNSASLSNPTYSMNPGGVTSINPTFAVSSTLSATYTLYVTGTNSNSAVITTSNWVLVQPYGPVFSLVSSPLNYALGCGTNSLATVTITNAQSSPFVGGAVSYSFLAPGSGPPATTSTLSSVPTVSITSPGTWSAVVMDNASSCLTFQTFTIQQNTNVPNAVIVTSGTAGCSATSQHLVNNSTTGIPPGAFPNNGPVVAYLWEGPAPFIPVSNSSTCVANAPGVYTMHVRDENNGCTSSATISVNVSGLAAAFVHTVSNGQVTFSDASLGTQQNTAYFWNFGDGTYSTAQNPTHTYQNAGSHLVKLKITNTTPFNCVDSTIQSVNVTGINCQANSNFTLAQTTTTLVWNAIPDYPWNISSAIWIWGDGSTSNSLYTSHQYSAAGMYNICLQVTVSCVASSSTCATYSVNRSSSGILRIDVVSPELVTGLLSQENQKKFTWAIVPNPGNGTFVLDCSEMQKTGGQIVISDMTGREVLTSSISFGEKEVIHLEGVSDGIYFVTLRGDGLSVTRKLVLSR